MGCTDLPGDKELPAKNSGFLLDLTQPFHSLQQAPRLVYEAQRFYPGHDYFIYSSSFVRLIMYFASIICLPS